MTPCKLCRRPVRVASGYCSGCRWWLFGMWVVNRPVTRLRYAAISVLDWIDAWVLRHRLYGFCCWVLLHPWRRTLCGNGCQRAADGFCVWCGWGLPPDVDRGPREARP